MKGLVYWSPGIYEGFMRMLYGDEFSLRYIEVAAALEGCNSVLDVCCGPARLPDFLEARIEYRGLDCNRTFVRDAARRGIEITEGNVGRVDLPRADALVMISALYQFIPDHEQLLTRMIAAAQKRVIVCEPVHHASRSHWLLSKAANILLDPGVPYSTERFDAPTLIESFARLGFAETMDVGTHEIMGVYEKREAR